MGCGCKAEGSNLLGGSRPRRRSRRSRRYKKQTKSASKKRKGNTRRVVKGGSLLGDHLTNMSNYTSGLIGSSGMPSLQFNPPANQSFNSGQNYVA